MKQTHKSLVTTLMLGAAAVHAPLANAQTTPSLEDMWLMIQSQQTKIDALETELANTQVETIQTQQSVEVIADAIDSTGGSGWYNNTQIGGYGELHYEGGAKDQIDFHRFVLFFGHDFTDNIRFFSELEVEHAIAGEGKAGEIELEQAYIEIDLGAGAQIYAGMHLVPVGLINETHEPPTFYGVERNAVEKNVIPATWWEGGIGASGNIGDTGFSYSAMASSGLNLNAGNGYKIRSGRQKLGNAKFNSQAYSGRLAYSGIPGVTMASSLYYQPDVTQNVGDSVTGDNVSAFLWEAHVDAKYKGFGLRALYADWSLDGTDVTASGRDSQNGFYIEPSFKMAAPIGYLDSAQIGVFYRYSNWDNNNGLDNNTGTKRSVFGVDYWPIDDVVLKMDYIIEDKDSSVSSKKSMNLGIGYQF